MLLSYLYTLIPTTNHLQKGHLSMTSEEARQRAEKVFKQEERAREGRAATTEYEAHGRAVLNNMARLRALRLAKKAQPNRAASDQR